MHSMAFLNLFFMFALSAAAAAPENGAVAKAVLPLRSLTDNRLQPSAWQPWQAGFTREGDAFVCNNGTDAKALRGLGQTVILNQKLPQPIVATAMSKAEGVSGSPDADYSIYLDITFADGTNLWGQASPFTTGTHDWQQCRVFVMPQKPIQRVGCYLLLRNHAGKAWFREPQLQVVAAPPDACMFDGVAVAPAGPPLEGFQVRDVAAGSDFVRIGAEALGLKLTAKTSMDIHSATFFDVTLSDTTGKDRAVTLLYAVPVDAKGLSWLHDPSLSVPVEPNVEYINATRFHAGNGRLSRYPLAAVANQWQRTALGIDMARPAFYRIAYNAGTGELFLAYDFALTPEKPSATVRFCKYFSNPIGQIAFDSNQEFRAALMEYYVLFPEYFRTPTPQQALWMPYAHTRTPQQGLWMPFAKISQVKGWEDFGFKFKEGNDETRWDDEHNILTFRYTEPMTWWMPMPKDMPRTIEAVLAEAKRLADRESNTQAKALTTSVFHNETGRPAARFLDTPWCNGAVWSMNSMPGISGEATDFKNKWNPTIRDRLYGQNRDGDLDGEYIDSIEGYATDELDFRREHFAAADTPLVFSSEDYKPAIFRGLAVFEYARAIAGDMHGMGKLMMANATPDRLSWLAPLLDVMGTETDWNPGGKWQPMTADELLYRRALCSGKPYCFLMNTDFDRFPSSLVEKYMKRALAYGMFPGFFSHNASEKQYFTRPELYERDRPLFKKYLPLCKVVAEAGWEPLTMARCSDPRVRLERFGNRYLTVFNDSAQRRAVTIEIGGFGSRELVTGREIARKDGKMTMTLDAEDVAVIDTSGMVQSGGISSN
jgi:hypothetical protein